MHIITEIIIENVNFADALSRIKKCVDIKKEKKIQNEFMVSINVPKISILRTLFNKIIK